jgi:hypothetical protein
MLMEYNCRLMLNSALKAQVSDRACQSLGGRASPKASPAARGQGATGGDSSTGVDKIIAFPLPFSFWPWAFGL